jgi:hypothetical protein
VLQKDQGHCVLYPLGKVKNVLPGHQEFLDYLMRLFLPETLIQSRMALRYRCRGPGFDSRALQKKIVGLERDPLSLVSTTEELLDRKVAAPV